MKVNSDPKWQAMVAAIVKNHAEGDVITHGELNTILRLEEPNYADYQDDAEYKKAMTTYAFVRLSTIEHADQILVLRDGDVVEQGTHRQLMDRKGFYHQLYAAQFE